MTIQVKFHDFKLGQAGVGTQTAPANLRPVDHLGATFRGETEGYFTLDASYPAGGYPITAKQLGLQQISGIICENPSGYDLMYNRSTGKLQVFSTGNTEVAAATNLSTLQPAYFKAFGVIL